MMLTTDEQKIIHAVLKSMASAHRELPVGKEFYDVAEKFGGVITNPRGPSAMMTDRDREMMLTALRYSAMDFEKQALAARVLGNYDQTRRTATFAGECVRLVEKLEKG